MNQKALCPERSDHAQRMKKGIRMLSTRGVIHSMRVPWGALAARLFPQSLRAEVQ